ncbi:glycoside hydrolase family 26 protein [Pseudonocardia sp. ICBG601]|uniref:glycoside hydrolase family 26 protein n=1 Tax=Pseudonocardia sp. ICBG601 TaxID=2846759 RepID=UPI001CF66139|nr:glycosyl hydrolase [Pseudonocardia sp. ICBG601]
MTRTSTVRRALIATAAVALLGAVLVGCTAAAPEPADDAVPLVPGHGIHLGLYYGSGSIADTTAAIGRTPRIHLTYVDWPSEWATSPVVAEDLAAGRIPLVNWEPFDVAFPDIVAGRYDAMLRTRAQQAAALRAPFFLDLAAEMNEEEGWGGHDPALYVAAWRHVHDVFTEAGADNVVWVWAPNNTDSAGAPPATAYYPGDDYVDWIGMDGYNWGTSDPAFTWQSFGEVFGPLYDAVAGHGKPMLVGETASDDRGGDKAAWIDDVVPTLRDRFPLIRAVVWFDVDKERHWQVGSSPEAAAAFARLAADPYVSTG